MASHIEIQQDNYSSEQSSPQRYKTGFDCEFVDKPSKEVQSECPVCLQIIREPYQVTCCGYSFCRSCIQRVKADNKPCPTCNVNEFSDFPDKRLKRYLTGLKVQCSHQIDGCEWTGELGQLDAHINTDSLPENQLNGCQFAEIDCLYCEEKMQRQYIKTHQNEHCTKRPFSCEHCHDYESNLADVLHNHWPMCGSFPVRCPNECGSFPQRQNVDSHVADECPLTTINCDFLHVGCSVKLPRRDMPEHLRENLSRHMSLLATSHTQQQTVITEQQDQIASLVAQNKKQTTEVEDNSHTIESFSRRIEAEMTRLSEAHARQEGQLGELKTAIPKYVRMTTMVAAALVFVAMLLAAMFVNASQIHTKIQALDTTQQNFAAVTTNVTGALKTETMTLREIHEQLKLIVWEPYKNTVSNMTNFQQRNIDEDQWFSHVQYNHWPKCGSSPVYPNECGSFPQHQNVDNHVADECPLTTISCDFLHTGCSAKPPREDMPEHLRENLLTNMSLLATSHDKQQAQLTRQEDQFTKQQAVIAKQQDHIARLVAETIALRKKTIEAVDKSETLSQRMETELTRLSEAYTHQERQLGDLMTEHLRNNNISTQISLLATSHDKQQAQITRQEDQLTKQQAVIAEQQDQITKQQAVITEQEDQIASLVAEINGLNKKTTEADETLSQRMETEVTRLNEAYARQERKLGDLMSEHLSDNISTQISLLATSHDKQQAQITRQEGQLTKQQAVIAEQQDQITRQQDQITRQQDQLTKQEDQITRQQDQLTKQEDQITKQQAVITEQQDQIASQVAEINGLNKKTTEADETLSQRMETEVTRLSEAHAHQEGQLGELTTTKPITLVAAVVSVAVLLAVMFGTYKLITKHTRQISSIHTKIQTTQQNLKENQERLNLTVLFKYKTTVLNMTNFQQHKNNGDQWFSPPVYTQLGYKICLKVYANGYGDGKNTHVSAFIYFMKGAFDDGLKWPFRGAISFRLLDQTYRRNHETNSLTYDDKIPDQYCSRVTEGERAGSGWGYCRFIPHTKLEPKYLQNNTLLFQIHEAKLQ